MPRERKAILSALPSKGFTLEDGKDHHVLRFFHEGLLTSVYTKVSRGTGYREYSDRLLAKMSRQLKITRSQLDGLIDCDMDQPGYVDALRKQGHLGDEPSPTGSLARKG
jgi:hypothetical protein